jgi:hypothetical protein
MVFFNGTYYDPSYGTTFPNESAVDDLAIAAYACGIQTIIDEPQFGMDFNNDGDTNDADVPVIVFSIVPNPPGNYSQYLLQPYPVNYP